MADRTECRQIKDSFLLLRQFRNYNLQLTELEKSSSDIVFVSLCLIKNYLKTSGLISLKMLYTQSERILNFMLVVIALWCTVFFSVIITNTETNIHKLDHYKFYKRLILFICLLQNHFHPRYDGKLYLRPE